MLSSYLQTDYYSDQHLKNFILHSYCNTCFRQNVCNTLFNEQKFHLERLTISDKVIDRRVLTSYNIAVAFIVFKDEKEGLFSVNYIVLDLEWNQDLNGKQGKKHERLPFEIIEIGAIKLDEKKNTIGEFSQLIKPNVYKNMHYITENMVHIHMDELQREKSFVKVVKDFLKWCGEDYIFCTWGSLDLIELQRNMRYYHLPLLNDGPLEFLDVQKLYSIEFEDGKARRSLEAVVDALKIEKDIPFHRAFSDAYYTAKVLEHISADTEEYCSYDVCSLPKSKENEVYKTFSRYAKYISREFEDKTAAIQDRGVMSTRCYICNKAARRKIKWFTPNSKHFYSVSFCEKHGYLKGKIRIRKSIFEPSKSDKVYVVKTLKLISEEEVNDIIQKQKHARQVRKNKRKQLKETAKQKMKE